MKPDLGCNELLNRFGLFYFCFVSIFKMEEMDFELLLKVLTLCLSFLSRQRILETKVFNSS
jgi:hypothetical protein